MLFPFHHYIHTHVKKDEKELFIKLHSKRWAREFDKVMIFVGLISPLMAIPQIIDVFVNQDAGRVSGFSWGGNATIDVFWLLYGVSHRSKPLIFSSIFWIVADLLVVIGVIIY